MDIAKSILIFFSNMKIINGAIPQVEQVNRMHDYMRKYNHGVLDKALEEYRNDFKH